MKIEAGKFYRTRGGQRAEVYYGSGEWRWYVTRTSPGSVCTGADGRIDRLQISDLDLVAPWQDEPAVEAKPKREAPAPPPTIERTPENIAVLNEIVKLKDAAILRADYQMACALRDSGELIRAQMQPAWQWATAIGRSIPQERDTFAMPPETESDPPAWAMDLIHAILAASGTAGELREQNKRGAARRLADAMEAERSKRA